MADWDARHFGEAGTPIDRDGVEAAMVDHMQTVADRGEPWSHVSRHLLGLRNGLPGARHWRQVWSDHRLKAEPPRKVSQLARGPAEALA
jgi:tRNA-dihydrouridine synthase A